MSGNPIDEFRAEADQMRAVGEGWIRNAEQLDAQVWKRTARQLQAEVARLRVIEQAARNLDAHKDEGYATVVSYLIRLHEALGRNNRA